MHANHELSILTKLVEYKNLSNAAQTIGLSQSQLSRIIGKLELELKIKLLKRDSKRHSAWTEEALQISKAYKSSQLKFKIDLESILNQNQQKEVRIGTLEGLSDVASHLVKNLIQHLDVVHLDIYDLDDLEKKLINQDLDMIFTCREMTLQKFKYSEVLGYQSLKKSGIDSNIEILSEFQYLKKSKKKSNPKKILVSNSLGQRKKWIEEGIGSGVMPSDIIRLKKNQRTTVEGNLETVYLLANEDLSPKIWETVLKTVI